MRCMNLNKSTLWYALYKGREQVKDEYGNLSGEYKLTYENPQEFKANISAARGESQSNQFGENASYDKTIVLDKDIIGIDEYTVLWIDSTPQLNEDGSLATDENGNIITPHDYIVRKVADSLHTRLLAVSKVTVSG